MRWVSVESLAWGDVSVDWVHSSPPCSNHASGYATLLHLHSCFAGVAFCCVRRWRNAADAERKTDNPARINKPNITATGNTFCVCPPFPAPFNPAKHQSRRWENVQVERAGRVQDRRGDEGPETPAIYGNQPRRAGVHHRHDKPERQPQRNRVHPGWMGQHSGNLPPRNPIFDGAAQPKQHCVSPRSAGAVVAVRPANRSA